MDWSQILMDLIPGIVGALIGAIAIGWTKLGDLVSTSKTKIDDIVFEAIDKGIKEASKNKE